MTGQVPPQPTVPSVDQLRELTVHGHAIVDRLRGLSGTVDERAHYARLRMLSAGETWQYIHDGVAEQDSNSFVLGFSGLLSTGVPLADAPGDLRAQTEQIEGMVDTLGREYYALLVPLYNANGQGLLPDLAADLPQRLPELADLV